MNVFDFDKTIYDGDSSVDFYLFCLKKKPWIIFLIPIVFWGFICYKLNLKEKEYFKEKYFMFLRFFSDVNIIVKDFWDKNEQKIKKWYLDMLDSNDLIITASPEFLIREIVNRLSIKNLIASKVDESTGHFLSKNCYGDQKVIMYRQQFKNKKVKNFYSDSMSDLPMMKISEKAYIVNKNSVKLLHF